MLRELQLSNFKSFAEGPQKVQFAPVTIFVGANGSGKSNVFDALRFMQGLVLGLPISDVLGGRSAGGRQVFEGIRGGAAEVAWNPGGFTTLQVDVECQPSVVAPQDFEYEEDGHESAASPSGLVHVSHRIKFDAFDAPMIDEESLSQVVAGPRVDVVRADRFADDQPTVHFGLDRTAYHFSEVEFLSSTLNLIDYGRDRRTVELVRGYRREWDRLLLFDFRPADMRDYSDSRLHQLERTGRNLSTVIHNVCADAEAKQRILEWVSALCAPAVTDIEFITTSLGDVMIQLVEGEGELRRVVSARSMSDGTLRFMALLAALFSAPEGSTFLLEEIENGLHPTRIHLLVELLEQFAEGRKIQVVATTHNSQVLLGLSEASLRNAVLFARDEERRGTVVRRLGDLPDFDEVTHRTRIDELFTTGWLEFAV